MTILSEPSGVVRFAVDRDARQLLDLCRLMHAENGLFPLSEAKVEHELRSSIQQDGGVIGVIGAPGSPVGAAWLIAGCDWYTETPSINDRMVYVHPDHREGTTHARDLLIWARSLSDQLGPLLIGVLSCHRAAAKVRFYQRLFGPPRAFLFTYGLDAGSGDRPEVRIGG
jgi:hypothetical protein